MGEFNVNKSDGSLEQTAGMPSEYPASQVMMSDGVTSVEDALDGLMDNILTQYTNVIGYTSSFYTFPSDGYVQLAEVNTSNAGGALDVQIYGSDGKKSITHSVRGVANYGGLTSSIFVRKGMKMKVTLNINPDSSNSVRFISLG